MVQSDHIVPLTPPGTGDFATYRTHYRTLIRPPGHDAMLRQAYGVDARFAKEHQHLRQILKMKGYEWADDLGLYLIRNDAVGDRFSSGDMETLRTLYSAHNRNVFVGRFDARYLDTLDDVALFLAMHEVAPLWIHGMYHMLAQSFLDLIIAADSMSNKVVRHSVTRALFAWIALETGEIQRVHHAIARLTPRALVAGAQAQERA